jgi:TRAP-type C4-dicarboxylate transport system permease large subunit
MTQVENGSFILTTELFPQMLAETVLGLTRSKIVILAIPRFFGLVE